MNTKIYFNPSTMARLGNRTRNVGGLFLDAETALVKANKAKTPDSCTASEKIAVERLKNAKDELLAVISDINEAIRLGYLS